MVEEGGIVEERLAIVEERLAGGVVLGAGGVAEAGEVKVDLRRRRVGADGLGGGTDGLG